MRILKVSLLLITAVVFGAGAVRADSVTLKDDRMVKGVIVEDYHDRIVISTYEGEVFLKKEDIRGLIYDSEDQNLVKLGEMALERGKYEVAFAYFQKAYLANPESKKAKDGVVYLQSLIFKKETQGKKEAEVQRRTEFEEGKAQAWQQKTIKEKEEQLKKELGLIIKMGEVNPQVLEVTSGSAAYQAGIERGDIIIAIWGNLTGYMDIGKVIDLLLDKAPSEKKITVERLIEVQIEKERGFVPDEQKLIGASFSMELDGLTVSSVFENSNASKAGLKKGDLIMEIDGSQTRYLPLKLAVEMIYTKKFDTVKFSTRRELSMW